MDVAMPQVFGIDRELRETVEEVCERNVSDSDRTAEPGGEFMRNPNDFKGKFWVVREHLELFYGMPQVMLLWVYLESNKLYEDRNFIFRKRIIRVAKGTCVTSSRDIAQKLKIEKTQLFRYLRMLQDMSMIGYECVTGALLITLCYDSDNLPVEKRPCYDSSTDAERGCDDGVIGPSTKEVIQGSKKARKQESKRMSSDGGVVTPTHDVSDFVPAASQAEPELGGNESQPESQKLHSVVEPASAQKTEGRGSEHQPVGQDEPKPEPAKKRPVRPTDPGKAQKFDLQHWAIGILGICKWTYLLHGLDGKAFPSMDGRAMGRVQNEIIRLGGGNLRLGVQKVLAAVNEGGQYFGKTGDTYWMPTLQNLLQREKLARTLAKVKESELESDWPIPEDALQFEDFAWDAVKRAESGDLGQASEADVARQDAEREEREREKLEEIRRGHMRRVHRAWVSDGLYFGD